MVCKEVNGFGVLGWCAIMSSIVLATGHSCFVYLRYGRLMRMYVLSEQHLVESLENLK